MRCVYEIKRIVAMEETQLLVCLSFLLEIEAISLIDMFDVCNVYFLQDFESIWKEDVLTELYEYSRIRRNSLPSSRQEAGHSLGSQSTVEEIEAGNAVDFDELRGLLALFHPNTSILQILQTRLYTQLSNRIDIHRFVIFCCVHRILKRVYVYPCISNDITGFYLHFNNTLSVRRNGSVTPQMPDDNVGMSMDYAGGGKRYEEDDEVMNLNIRKRNGKSCYRELFACYHFSLFHASHESNSISRHSSCLSLNHELLLANPCTCHPDSQKIRKMVTKHCCLESIALHNECCIPAVMRCLENQDDIVFLKAWVCLLQRRSFRCSGTVFSCHVPLGESSMPEIGPFSTC